MKEDRERPAVQLVSGIGGVRIEIGPLAHARRAERLLDQRLLRPKVTKEGDLVDLGLLSDAPSGGSVIARLGEDAGSDVEKAFPGVWHGAQVCTCFCRCQAA